MALFKPRDYGKFAYHQDEGPTLPSYSISSYAQATKFCLNNQSNKTSAYPTSRKYGFDKSSRESDTISNDVELPIYAGSFMFQDTNFDRHKEAFTSYSRKYAENNKSRESMNENKIKMPVFSYRARYDLFDGSTRSTESYNDYEIESASEELRRKSNITNYHKAANEKKKAPVEPLIPIRRYEKEKKLFTLDMNNQNISGNVNVSKYGVKPSRTREEDIKYREAEKFANKTKIQRVYPEVLLDSSEISIEDTTQNKNADKGGNSDQMSFDFDKPSNTKQSSKKGEREITIKDGTTFQIPASAFQQNNGQKPIFSQFKSDVFAKYAERKMNEKNGKKQANHGSFNLDGSSDDYLLNSSLENNDKNAMPTSQQTNDKFNTYQNGNQGTTQAKPKENLVVKDDTQNTTTPRYTDTIDIEALLKPRNDDILERLEKFKKEMEESKKMAQNDLNTHADDFNNRESDSPLLSESESADTSKAQDDMLSEPSLIFEERPEMF